jgi:hypothetical protein
MCHWVAEGSASTVRWMWFRKSASLRVEIRGGANLPRRHIQIDDERLGAVPNVLILAPLHFARSHRQSRVFALQCLNTAQFVDAHHAFPVPGQFRRLTIQAIDV